MNSALEAVETGHTDSGGYLVVTKRARALTERRLASDRKRRGSSGDCEIWLAGWKSHNHSVGRAPS